MDEQESLRIVAPSWEEARTWAQGHTGLRRPPFKYLPTPNGVLNLDPAATLHVLGDTRLSRNMRRAVDSWEASGGTVTLVGRN